MLIDEYADEVEKDLINLNIDFRDYYRPHGGKSQLTFRRLRIILHAIDPQDSFFWTEVSDIDKVNQTTRAVSAVYQALTEHPYYELELKKKKKRKEEIKKLTETVRENENQDWRAEMKQWEEEHGSLSDVELKSRRKRK